MSLSIFKILLHYFNLNELTVCNIVIYEVLIFIYVFGICTLYHEINFVAFKMFFCYLPGKGFNIGFYPTSLTATCGNKCKNNTMSWCSGCKPNWWSTRPKWYYSFTGYSLPNCDKGECRILVRICLQRKATHCFAQWLVTATP